MYQRRGCCVLQDQMLMFAIRNNSIVCTIKNQIHFGCHFKQQIHCGRANAFSKRIGHSNLVTAFNKYI